MDHTKFENGISLPQGENQMEEISLKELLQIIIKGKFVIITFTIIAILLGAALYKIIPGIYKSTVSVLANPINQVQSDDYTNKLILPTMDIHAYTQQFLNSYTLSKTIEKLDLRGKDGEYISQESLESKITVDNPSNTNILHVSVSDTDAELSTQIANTISQTFINYITEIYQSSAGASAKALEEQLKIEQKNLDNEASELRDYLTNSFNIDTLNSEITSLISQITSYKSRLNDLESTIEADRATIAYMNNHIDISVLDTQDFDMQANVKTRDYTIQLNTENPNELEKILLTLSIAEIEKRFIENTNSHRILKPMVAELESRLSDLQAKKAEEEYKYNGIIRDYQMAESIYETYKSQYRQALIIETSNMGTVNVRILAEAIVPDSVSNKSILMYGAVSAMLGLFIGIFVVLFKNYWLSEPAGLPVSRELPLS